MRAGMVYWIKHIPHTSDPGSIPGYNTTDRRATPPPLQLRGRARASSGEHSQKINKEGFFFMFKYTFT